MTYTAKITAPFQVEYSCYDASRPWRVVATFRNFNTVIGYYATKSQAMRRAYDKNRQVANQF